MTSDQKALYVIRAHLVAQSSITCLFQEIPSSLVAAKSPTASGPYSVLQRYCGKYLMDSWPCTLGCLDSCLSHSRRAHCCLYSTCYLCSGGILKWEHFLTILEFWPDWDADQRWSSHLPTPPPPPPPPTSITHNQTTILPGLPKQTNASARQPSLFLLASLHQREPESCQHCQLSTPMVLHI